MSSVTRKRPRTYGEEFILDSDEQYVAKKVFSPRINIYEDTDSNVRTVTFELPGLKPGDISILFLHDKLTVSGETADQQPKREGSYSRRELPYGTFSRVLTVPLGMEPKDFKARMENGLLTLSYPIDPPKQEPYRIPVE